MASEQEFGLLDMAHELRRRSDRIAALEAKLAERSDKYVIGDRFWYIEPSLTEQIDAIREKLAFWEREAQRSIPSGEIDWPATMSQLRAKLAAAQADTKRLDWLEAHDFDLIKDEGLWLVVSTDEVGKGYQDTARETIDAAREESE